MYRKMFKVVCDFIFSVIIIFLSSPIFLFMILLLSIVNNGSPFFTQTRSGKNGKNFKIIKFKTMNDKRDNAGNLLSDVERLTKLGKFIRKVSIDEIPQFINVLKGEMSLIGPRPLLVEYMPLYSKKQSRRHEVKPGITGWAQVNGRNAIFWEEKFEYDVWYVDNLSFVLDVKIFFLSMKKVLTCNGINLNDNQTMKSFKGSK